MNDQERESLRMLAKSWNNLDIRFIQDQLTEDVTYESQWVLKPIDGKQKFLTYLNSKFIAIKSAMESEPMVVKAEMAFLPTIKNRPCLVLTQTAKSETRKTTVLIEILIGKIKRIDMCFIPDPEEAELTGEFPT